MGILKFKKPDGFHPPEKYQAKIIPPEIEAKLRTMERFLETIEEKIYTEDVERRRAILREIDFERLCRTIKLSTKNDLRLYPTLQRAMIDEIRSRTETAERN